MRKFTTKLSFFAIILVLILFGIFLLNRHFANFKIGDNKRILIIGHSHSECAYNDSLISGVANFSQSGESYFYTYFKTKKLIERNPNIRTVFIEFTNNQIDKSQNDCIWGNKYMSYRFPKYGAFMDLNSYKLLLKENPKCFLSSSKTLIKYSIKSAFRGFKNQDDIGGYLYLVRDKTDSLLANVSIHSISENKPQELSEKNIEYLRKTVDYLVSKNKKVFLIRSPLHKRYEGFNNEKQFQKLLKRKFSDIEFLDFSQFPLLNLEFGDLGHLNHKGATKFSIWFSNLLNNGLLEKDKKQNIIDGEMIK
jgi:hypothetical protein